VQRRRADSGSAGDLLQRRVDTVAGDGGLGGGEDPVAVAAGVGAK
jgi:hypothetical protein